MSVLLGVNKLIERSYVMLFVLDSTVSNTPFSFPYMVLGFALNQYGNKLILLVSKVLCAIVITQYFLALLNFTNVCVYGGMPLEFGGLV